MRLFVEPMNAVVVEVDGTGWVNIENEGWSVPTLQERRAIIYAARDEMSALDELITILENPTPGA
jgi:hypothetical protein